MINVKLLYFLTVEMHRNCLLEYIVNDVFFLVKNPSFSELKKKVDKQDEFSYPLLQWYVCFMAKSIGIHFK